MQTNSNKDYTDIEAFIQRFAPNIRLRILFELGDSHTDEYLEDLANHHTFNVFQILMPLLIDLPAETARTQAADTIVEATLEKYLAFLRE